MSIQATRCAIAIAATVAGISPAAAAGAPRWDVGEICASSSLGPTCPTIESQNRRTLLLRWEALPTGDREACTAVVISSGKLSYKQLLNCLEERQLKALEADPLPTTPQHTKS